MQTVGYSQTNDGNRTAVQIDETITEPAYRQQVSIVLTQVYFPIDSAYAPRASWPNGGCPARLDPGTCIVVSVLEAESLMRGVAGAMAKSTSRVGSNEPPPWFDV
jgi:hypothetical protein